MWPNKTTTTQGGGRRNPSQQSVHGTMHGMLYTWHSSAVATHTIMTFSSLVREECVYIPCCGWNLGLHCQNFHLSTPLKHIAIRTAFSSNVQPVLFLDPSSPFRAPPQMAEGNGRDGPGNETVWLMETDIINLWISYHCTRWWVGVAVTLW